MTLPCNTWPTIQQRLLWSWHQGIPVPRFRRRAPQYFCITSALYYYSNNNSRATRKTRFIRIQAASKKKINNTTSHQSHFWIGLVLSKYENRSKQFLIIFPALCGINFGIKVVCFYYSVRNAAAYMFHCLQEIANLQKLDEMNVLRRWKSAFNAFNRQKRQF